MKRIKIIRIVLVGAVISMACFFAGCGRSFFGGGPGEKTIRQYVQATLDNEYRNDSTLYVKLGIGTAGEAEESYENFTKELASSFCEVRDNDGNYISAGEAEDAQWLDIIRTLLKSVRYDVVSATSLDADKYAVDIIYEQTEFFNTALTLYSERLAEQIGTVMETCTDSLSYNIATMRIYRDCFKEALGRITYKPAQNIMITVRQDENGIYFMDEDTFTTLLTLFMDVENTRVFPPDIEYPGVRLGKYKGIVAKRRTIEVTDESVRAAICEAFMADAKETDRTTAEKYDVVTIDLKASYAGSAELIADETGYEIMIGTESFLPEIQEHLIGSSVGETLEFEVAYPTDSDNYVLAGKTLAFVITVKNIKVLPELTDAFIAQTTEFSTYSELWDHVTVELKAAAEEEIENAFREDVIEAVIADAVFDKTLEEEAYAYAKEIRMAYQDAAQERGMSYRKFVEVTLDMTLDEFEEELEETAIFQIQAERVLYAIALREGLTVTKDEFESYAATTAADAGYETTEEFLEDYGAKEIRKMLMRDKALSFVLGNATVQ